ncbi:unnamed protein product [Cuscuta europaea]|uniref:Uncharacterized protein n=1 Tax=Cuscuta europaea TaxID=41803 RepID=A0A9P1EA40_CUSEU|nr:unnamed protein product [Cuscuta europaea]
MFEKHPSSLSASSSTLSSSFSFFSFFFSSFSFSFRRSFSEESPTRGGWCVGKIWETEKAANSRDMAIWDNCGPVGDGRRKMEVGELVGDEQRRQGR